MTVVQAAPWIGGALAIGGVGAALSRRRDYLVRWCAWTVAVPAVLGAFALGEPGLTLLAALGGTVCAAEYAALARLRPADRVVLHAAALALPAAAWLTPGRLPQVLAAAVLAALLIPVLAADADDGARRLAFTAGGILWFAPLAGAVLLGNAVLALFAAVSVTDITASLAGRRLRGPKLSPISPDKTWSGALCGAAAGLAALAALDAFTPAHAAAVLLGAPLGDLLESLIKRSLGAKDSASWLAGAGGLLDRLDSLLLTLALALLPAL
ncbi:phosphatidate cytidylyltransferase [Actinomadura fulvescens]|uniref:Phosphatidate cytidylyltransferase n=1 Tax=Actinomadura fulvescens TaxID=46160 RepID=A0ABN3QKP4_9ACTN